MSITLSICLTMRGHERRDIFIYVNKQRISFENNIINSRSDRITIVLSDYEKPMRRNLQLHNCFDIEKYMSLSIMNRL